MSKPHIPPVITKERKERFALTLSMSLVVFVTNILSLAIAILTVLLFAKLGVVKNMDGELSLAGSVVLLIIVSIIMGMLITMLTSKFTLKPINRIINQFNRLAQGDFSARLFFGNPIGNHPSIKEVANSFNRAAQELEQTEMLRHDFINNFSHEFKTPIVSIAGFASLLRHGNLSEAEQQEYLQVIEEESLRLSYMATNILNLTKIENQTILTDVSKFNLSEQIRSALLLLADQWSAKNITPNAEFEEIYIEANEELLKEVWINLIDNAVKFADINSVLTVKITQEQKHTIISITNQGPEIPQESLSRIFNKFYQVDQSHATEGHGIGLAIVKKVVELHNGQINVESVQHHTTFSIKL